jgi:hypothetical protein
VHISGTQNYLALTPEILRQASQRFERKDFSNPVLSTVI